MAGRKATTAQVRFDEKVSPPNERGCRLWTGGRTSSIPGKGYGLFYSSTARTMVSAHRWLYEQTSGELPDHIDVCHKCDVRLCVSLDHLFPGTRQQNMDDALAKGRHVGRYAGHEGRKGEAHPLAKLDSNDVRAIRQLREDGWTLKLLASSYEVSIPAIHAVVSGRTWSHTT